MINNSENQVDIYTKNGVYWDNYGWCDGERASGGKISIKKNESAVYCGGNWNTTTEGRVQHEWWFYQNGNWNQTFSEQWITTGYSKTKIAEFNDFDNESNLFIPLAKKGYECNKSGNCSYLYRSYFYTITDSYINSLRDFITNYWGIQYTPSFEDMKEYLKSEKVNEDTYINKHRTEAMRNTATVYEVMKNGKEMTVECYALSVLFDWKDHNSLRQGENLCLDEHGNKKIIKIER